MGDGRCPPSYRAASLALVLEGVLVITILTVTVMGTQLPPWLIYARVEPSSLLIAVLRVVGIRLIGKARTGLTCGKGRVRRQGHRKYRAVLLEPKRDRVLRIRE